MEGGGANNGNNHFEQLHVLILIATMLLYKVSLYSV